jgi:superfamily I DNA/RNA helicase
VTASTVPSDLLDGLNEAQRRAVEAPSGMWLGTFHALGARLLRRDGESSGQGGGAARQPGLDARTLQYGDLVERGIVDPTKGCAAAW